jgi:hypothetical protein
VTAIERCGSADHRLGVPASLSRHANPSVTPADAGMTKTATAAGIRYTPFAGTVI